MMTSTTSTTPVPVAPSSLRDILQSVEDQSMEIWTEDNYAEWVAQIMDKPRDEMAMGDQDMEAKGSDMWWGDNMWSKGNNVGCRIITINAAKKLPTTVDKDSGTGETEKYVDSVIEYMANMETDVGIIHEPGAIKNFESTVRHSCEKGGDGMTAICAPSEDTKAAGAVILLSAKWTRVLDTHRVYKDGDGETRVVTMEFKAKSKRHGTKLQRMMIQAVYGYNYKNGEVAKKSADMWEYVHAASRKFKTTHPHASLVVAGDLNAAKSTKLDTNRPVGAMEADKREKEAAIIDAMEGRGIRDVFRAAHPTTRAWTREPTGELEHVQASRRIDHVLATEEISHHPATKIGIHKGYMLESDHCPVVCDFPIDCAEIALDVCPVWNPVVVHKTQMKPEVTEEDREAFADQASALMTGIDMSQPPRVIYGAVKDAIKTAAVGTIAIRKKLCYPKFVSKCKHFTKDHYALRTWRKRIRAASLGIKLAELCQRPWAAAEKDCRKAAYALSTRIDSIVLDDLQDMAETLRTTPTKKALARLSAQEAIITAYLSRKNAYEAAKQKTEAAKRRNAHFDTPDGKGLGSFLSSVFKTARTNHNLAWARREDGTLADTPEAIGTLVKDKFEKWFATVVPVEERWGSWEAMERWDTSQMSGQKRNISPTCKLSFQDFVKECYIDPKMWEKAQQEGSWKDIMRTITAAEVKAAIKGTKLHTAPGESQVSTDMLSMLGTDSITVITDMFNKFKELRRIPDDMNTALLRLLPKTDQGLANLAKVRPIALMEALGKLYERVIISRITDQIDKFKILDMSQYGALAKAGGAPPLRVLAEVMEDARLSKTELHILALDLQKAFDTCEFWSQAMSWQALGMPKPMIDILINMDAGSNSPADPHEGPGATTKVILDAGHTSEPFVHGRGVRQGSVGGPIKWVVFMHFWLAWIKRTMPGKGYTMSTTKPRQHDGYVQEKITKYAGEAPEQTRKYRRTEAERNEPVEVQAQMFVDDSIWLADTPQNAQELARRCELFCDFHSILINKDKSQYISINDPGENITWTPDPGKNHGKPVERTGKHGPIVGGPNHQDGRTLK